MSLGNREGGGARKSSQENCLFTRHRLTYERWEGDGHLQEWSIFFRTRKDGFFIHVSSQGGWGRLPEVD
jgi:hypothetical protein